ncbi:SRPBCC family protein [Tahibacter caeni]|uniref:SRPBCC family protein n=1 Tax=Tahibacter caeni TaxID=1453545 RepID=UPI002147EDF2|nr:SRPBCC family protein [Tahibacter caeni]
MPSQTSRILLAATTGQAYDYLTTPSRWHEWHAASLGTVPDAPVSLAAGATFEENIRAAGFRRRLRWQVVAAQRPVHWEAVATMDDGSRLRLRYDFAADGEGTTFTRMLDYALHPRWLRVVDLVFGRRRIRRETAAALQALQAHFAR